MVSDWYPINRDEQERCAGILAHTHVALPLDVSQVSDAVVSRMIQSYYHEMYEKTTPNIHGAMRAAITALAAALGEDG